MGHSKQMQRYGSVDSFGQQCMKTQENLCKDVAHAKDMVISIKGMPCHSSTIYRFSSLMFRGLITCGHVRHQRSMSISSW